ncbi:MAG: immune inhibitor A domain-containing protein [Promethearchaeota archaeon]
MLKSLNFLTILLVLSCLFVPLVLSPSSHAIASLKQPQTENTVTVTTLTVLVVLIELPDDPHYPTHTLEYFEELFFSTKSLSVNQYYQNTSYGEVSLMGEVLGWYKAEHDLEYYGAGGRLEGVDIRPDYIANESRTHAIQAGRDPAQYDLFVVIHSGDGQEYSGNTNDIWSHQFDLRRFGLSTIRYSMNHEFVTYVTPSHELGHELYFPDLYDHANNFKNIFAGPYCLMAYGEGHLSIWNKYYSHVSRTDSVQFLSDTHRLQISDFSNETIVKINPIALSEPSGIMWLELAWNSSEFSQQEFGRGWTITVRENLDYDSFLPKFGVIIAEIQVGRRTSQIQTDQLIPNVYPPFNVVDAHPETLENKNDATFSLDDGEIGTYCSGEGWAVQLLDKFDNLSYLLRVTNESNIPRPEIIDPDQPLKEDYDILISVSTETLSTITRTEISIDNGPWLECTPNPDLEGFFSFELKTTEMREGTHLIRARTFDNASIPYIGYSPFVTVEVDNNEGSILVIDDDLGRSSEINVLSALDDLGYFGKYEIRQTTSITEAEITTEEMLNYETIIWVGNPSITPISNSHINYNEFRELKQYLESSDEKNPPRIIFMSNFNIFDFSNQGSSIQNEIDDYFRAQSPDNFRAPVSLLQGINFLVDLPCFTLGPIDSVRANRSSDGEVVTLLRGAVPILEDKNPEFQGYGTKGYYVDDGNYKLVNFLFQPELVPEIILPKLLNLTLNYLSEPNNSSFPASSAITSSESTFSTSSGINPLFYLTMLAIGSLSLFVVTRKFN